MNCPNCGAEITGGDRCEYCDTLITPEMRRRLEELNKRGCPRCGSRNLVFQREQEAVIWDNRSQKFIRRTVGICHDCGYTWYTDLPDDNNPPTPPKPPKQDPPPPPKKLSKKWLWLVAGVVIIIILITRCPKGGDNSGKEEGGEEVWEGGEEGTTEEVRELEYLTIDPIMQNDMDADNANISVYTGDMEEEDQDDVYELTPPREGVYRAELSDIHNNHDMKLTVEDSSGQVIHHIYGKNGDGLTLNDLEEDETYRIHVIYSSGASPYKLSVEYQKKTKDISDCTLIRDSIEFTDQDNRYHFTPSIDGTYRFEFSEIRDNKDMGLAVYNHLGERLKSTYSKNGDGLTMELEEGETYTVHVAESSGYSPYHLIVGQQKSPVDISDYDGVNDSIEYTDQDNTYLYTIPEGGVNYLLLTEIKAEKDVEVEIFNRLGERLRYGYCTNGETVSMDDLEEGETYEIHIQQSSGFTPYTLTIQ